MSRGLTALQYADFQDKYTFRNLGIADILLVSLGIPYTLGIDLAIVLAQAVGTVCAQCHASYHVMTKTIPIDRGVAADAECLCKDGPSIQPLDA